MSELDKKFLDAVEKDLKETEGVEADPVETPVTPDQIVSESNKPKPEADPMKAPLDIQKLPINEPKTEAEQIQELKARVAELLDKQAYQRKQYLTMEKVVSGGGPACARTGMCCETILLRQSPRDLRDAYHEAVRILKWPHGIPGMPSKAPIGEMEDIHLIYPMLAGKCRGKYKWAAGSIQFVYGPCKNLAREKIKVMKDGLEHEKEVAACSIHEDRPRLCSGYPDYGHFTPVQMGPDVKPRNPGYMRGCGYNADPQAGYPAEQFTALLPLEPGDI